MKGRLFEQFMIQETRKRLDYSLADYSLHYWRTNHGAEVDLLIIMDGKPVTAVVLLWGVTLRKSLQRSRGSLDGGD